MHTTLKALLLLVSMLLVSAAAPSQEAKPPEAKPAPPQAKAVPDDENSCIQCHAQLTEKGQERFHVTVKDLATDIHWQKGMRCQDCHGGDPTVFEIKAHQSAGEFHVVKSPTDVPAFCGNCHADVTYIKRFAPTLRTDQLSQYLTSGHGKKLQAGDPAVATCVSCHGKPHGSGADTAKQGILRVDNLESPVYRTRVAKTCAHCHADAKLMAGRQYQGRPLGHDQYAKWRESVHGKAMLQKGDLSAPTCNNCHGNHGALPPEVGSVANACGTCHGKVGKLFADAGMPSKFQKLGLPGCATCHQAHDVMLPSDEMVGVQTGVDSVPSYEARRPKTPYTTIAGAKVASAIRDELEKLKSGIDRAKKTLDEAEYLGMEVSQPQFDLRKASDALTNARSQVHSFKVAPVKAAVAEGEKVVEEVQAKGDDALNQHEARRIWLAASMVPILVVIVVLLLYIRVLPNPGKT
jgi:hypothetical protein